MAGSPNETAIFEHVAARVAALRVQPSVTATGQIGTSAVRLVRSNYRGVAVGTTRGFTRCPVRCSVILARRQDRHLMRRGGHATER
jgi:hypothetical protein